MGHAPPQNTPSPTPEITPRARTLTNGSEVVDPWAGYEEVTTEYTVSYLGHTFSLTGPEGLTIDDLRSDFDQMWHDNPWVEYTTSGSGTIYYYNIKSEKIYADRLEVWVMADHSKNRTTKARRGKLLYELKCDAQTIRELQSAEYDASGRVLSSFDWPDTPIRVIPETVGSALYDEMCKYRP